MRGSQRRLKPATRFREEVPRWFGLSVVLIYLAGLGAVAHFGISDVREKAAAQINRTTRYALNALVLGLSELDRRGPSVPPTAIAYQRALEDFVAQIPLESLRVIGSDRSIIASVDQAEIGTVARDERANVRFRIQNSQSDSPLYLEAVLLSKAPGLTGLADHASTLTVVLVVFGALLVIYRRLRGQFRGMSRIANRLESARDGVEHELASLRITDTVDHLTSAWNELIDSAEGWFQAVQQTDANEELSHMLQRSSGSALTEALNAVPDGIMLIVHEVRFEYLNSAVCRLFGWSADDAKQYSLPDAKADGVGGAILEMVRGAQQGDGTFLTCSELLEAGDECGGGQSSYRVQVLPLQGCRLESACVVLIRDVSQQVRADRAREDFVTQVTHELRTPLTNIRAYAETLSSGMFDDPKVISDCYNVITKETRRLSRLIEDILSVSQMEVGQIELSLDTVDLRALLSDGVRDVRGLADDKEIDLQLILPAKLEPINGDRDKLAVVINNLLGNAIKYTPRDGDIVVGCRFTGNEVVMTFKDNGIGIDPADHARIFEKFQRGTDPDVQNEPGTGIGLYTAREIVRRHGGDIEVISETGQGSTFVVRLPHVTTRAASMAPRDGQTPPAADEHLRRETRPGREE